MHTEESLTLPRAQNGKQRILAVFRELLQSPTLNLTAIEDYIDPAYLQTVDGVTLDYAGFVAHLRKQREIIASMEVDFTAMAEERDIVFTNHTVHATKQDGSKIVVKVIAQFVLKQGRIVSCDELTRLVQGGIEDRNLGSCR